MKNFNLLDCTDLYQIIFFFIYYFILIKHINLHLFLNLNITIIKNNPTIIKLIVLEVNVFDILFQLTPAHLY